MQKRIAKLKFFSLVLIVFIVGACSKGHELASAINGTYTVENCIDLSDCTIIGYLTLSEGQYTFVKEKGIDIPEDVANRFCFIQNPNGNYDLTYIKEYKPNDFLENTTDRDWAVASITFSQSIVNENCRDSSFFIGRSIEYETLYFHSLFSELQTWSVSKSWDD